MSSPVTRIGSPTSDVSRFVMRGRDVLKEIIGTMSFAEAFYFIIVGKDLAREKLPVRTTVANMRSRWRFKDITSFYGPRRKRYFL